MATRWSSSDYLPDEGHRLVPRWECHRLSPRKGTAICHPQIVSRICTSDWIQDRVPQICFASRWGVPNWLQYQKFCSRSAIKWGTQIGSIMGQALLSKNGASQVGSQMGTTVWLSDEAAPNWLPDGLPQNGSQMGHHKIGSYMVPTRLTHRWGCHRLILS